MRRHKVRANFNGLFGDVPCLSHEDTCLGEDGTTVRLHEGPVLTAYEEDAEHGVRDDLTACGGVEPAPAWLQRNGSKWILMIDENGVNHESDLRKI